MDDDSNRSSSGAAGNPVTSGHPMVFVTAVSSQVPGDSGLTIEEETRECLSSLEELLVNHGSGLDSLVKAGCFLSDDSYRSAFWAAWGEAFKDIDVQMVRLTQVVGLPRGHRVMVDAVAVRR